MWLMMQKTNSLIQENNSCVYKILEENKKIFQFYFYKEVFKMEENEKDINLTPEMEEELSNGKEKGE